MVINVLKQKQGHKNIYTFIKYMVFKDVCIHIKNALHTEEWRMAAIPFLISQKPAEKRNSALLKKTTEYKYPTVYHPQRIVFW